MEKMINWNEVYTNLSAAAEQFPRNTHDGPFYTKLAELINAAAVIRDFCVPVAEPAAPKQKREPETCGDMIREGYVRATTMGWDGKDYEGAGRCFPAWHKRGANDSKTYIRIFNRHHKTWCFLEVLAPEKDGDVARAEFAFSIDK